MGNKGSVERVEKWKHDSVVSNFYGEKTGMLG